MSCIATEIMVKIIQICQTLISSFSGPNDGGKGQEDWPRERISDPYECLSHSCAREGNKIRNRIAFSSIYNVSLTSLTLQLYVVSCCCLVWLLSGWEWRSQVQRRESRRESACGRSWAVWLRFCRQNLKFDDHSDKQQYWGGLWSFSHHRLHECTKKNVNSSADAVWKDKALH